jgi:hypothetical protein
VETIRATRTANITIVVLAIQTTSFPFFQIFPDTGAFSGNKRFTVVHKILAPNLATVKHHFEDVEAWLVTGFCKSTSHDLDLPPYEYKFFMISLGTQFKVRFCVICH